jgi:hypothetical protein
VVVAHALGKVKHHLVNEHGYSEARVAEALGRICIRTFGGAEKFFPLPTRNTHFVNDCDPVSAMFGFGQGETRDLLGRLLRRSRERLDRVLGEPGPDSELVHFSDEGTGETMSAHFMTTYLRFIRSQFPGWHPADDLP